MGSLADFVDIEDLENLEGIEEFKSDEQSEDAPMPAEEVSEEIPMSVEKEVSEEIPMPVEPVFVILRAAYRDRQLVYQRDLLVLFLFFHQSLIS